MLSNPYRSVSPSAALTTKDSGGDLGLVGPDEIASELILAANGLEPGQYSEVVRTARDHVRAFKSMWRNLPSIHCIFASSSSSLP